MGAADDINWSLLKWNDGPTGGTPLTAARGPNRWEAAIDALVAALRADEDEDDALTAALATFGALIPAQGTSADRAALSPTIAPKLFLDKTLGAWLYSDGSAWRRLLTDTVVADGGAAPTNFEVVASGSTLNFTWTGVASATGYKIRSTAFPSGVTGATSISGSATSFSLTGVADGTYELWITATVGGVDSAASNHDTVTVSTGAAAGPGTAASPYAFLQGGTSSGGHWNLGIGFSASETPSVHTDISEPRLKDNYTEPNHFFFNPTKTGVRMKVRADGSRTSTKTKYPRCEFRELKTDGSTKQAFKAGTGTHILGVASPGIRVVKFTAVKQEICLLQMHDADDDTIQIRQEGTNLVLKILGDTTRVVLGTCPVGTFFVPRLELTNGTLKTYINGALKHTSTQFVGDNTQDQYWKVGLYNQSNNRDQANAAADTAEIEIGGPIICSHS